MEKNYVSYKRVHKIVQEGSKVILESDFKPDYLLAIGGGGFIPARIMRTFIDRPIISLTVSRYDSNNNTVDIPVKHQWIDDINIDLNEKSVLIIDEVDDCRTTLDYCTKELLDNYDVELGIFVLHNKLKPKTGKIPDAVKYIFIGEDIDDIWVVYPWDSLDIESHERLSLEGGNS